MERLQKLENYFLKIHTSGDDIEVTKFQRNTIQLCVILSDFDYFEDDVFYLCRMLDEDWLNLVWDVDVLKHRNLDTEEANKKKNEFMKVECGKIIAVINELKRFMK